MILEKILEMEMWFDIIATCTEFSLGHSDQEKESLVHGIQAGSRSTLDYANFDQALTQSLLTMGKV
jgi:hypothetical protein